MVLVYTATPKNRTAKSDSFLAIYEKKKKKKSKDLLPSLLMVSLVDFSKGICYAHGGFFDGFKGSGDIEAGKGLAFFPKMLSVI